MKKNPLNIYLIGLWFLAWVTVISSNKTPEQLNWYSKTRIVQTHFRYSTISDIAKFCGVHRKILNKSLQIYTIIKNLIILK